MHSLHDPPVTRTRPAARRCWLGRSFLVGGLVAASVAVTSCGSSESPAPTILNTEKVERAIESSSAAQRGTRPRVSCPAGVQQKKGLEFSCIAAVKQVNTRFVVTQLDGAGQVHYEAR